jgi:hypothetical protein
MQFVSKFLVLTNIQLVTVFYLLAKDLKLH